MLLLAALVVAAAIIAFILWRLHMALADTLAGFEARITAATNAIPGKIAAATSTALANADTAVAGLEAPVAALEAAVATVAADPAA
jgi:hypothetical protein